MSVGGPLGSEQQEQQQQQEQEQEQKQEQEQEQEQPAQILWRSLRSHGW